ncbi:MAG: rRNA maturation RNase YbeY [Holosporaceae bacterium]|jgi:probable rRNA maturation factor|nr:rRNA maturation RNase YbeY [Holosporaceae bacterium]
MNLEISVEYDPWSRCDVQSITDECVLAVFGELKLNHYNVEICFLFTDDEELQILNKIYRGIDKPTNVLAFPADSIDNIKGDHPKYYEDDYSDNGDVSDEKNENIYCCNICILGSVALAYDTVERESIEQRKTFEDHLRHLVIHAVLHLLGYDHGDSSRAEQMEDLEIRILSHLKIANPY